MRWYRHEEGIDLEESFALVARMEAYQDICSLRCTQIFLSLSNGRENSFLTWFIKGRSVRTEGMVYVDDIIFGSTNPRCKRIPCGIFLNQFNYVLEILKKHRMDNCDPIGTPMATTPKLDLDTNGTFVDATKYRSMISSLMMPKHLQEYIRRNTILRRKAGELVLKNSRLYNSVNREGRICVSICLLCSSPLDENTVNGL
ncbi:hypothetical protein Tco_0887924 [Tanacetum coccineum]